MLRYKEGTSTLESFPLAHLLEETPEGSLLHCVIDRVEEVSHCGMWVLVLDGIVDHVSLLLCELLMSSWTREGYAVDASTLL